MLALDKVREGQRLAYQAVKTVRQQLVAGMTEKRAAKMIEDFFHQRGHHLFFHRPFAWFGDRTGFKNFKQPSLPSLKNPLPSLGLEFLPTDRKLEQGMAVTLDVAPAVDGLAVDIGYSFAFGDNPAVEKARRDLKSFRQTIWQLATLRSPIKDIYQAVETQLAQLGYQNCHALYPLGVLGHRIGQLPLMKFPKVSLMGFHPQAYAYLIQQQFLGPAFITASETRPLSPGLWAVEPHLGRGDFGVKFEEILVVTPESVYWLDDDLPHVTEV